MFKKDWNRISPYLIGFSASLWLLAFYLGVMTLTGDWYYAQIQFEQYRWWIIALSIGLGIQSTLFVLLKKGLGGKEKGEFQGGLEHGNDMDSNFSHRGFDFPL